MVSSESWENGKTGKPSGESIAAAKRNFFIGDFTERDSTPQKLKRMIDG
jgi:hypothetical protein